MLLLRQWRLSLSSGTSAGAYGRHWTRSWATLRQSYATVTNATSSTGTVAATTSAEAVGRSTHVVFFDNLFPIKRNRWDFRPHLAKTDKTALMKYLTTQLLPHELPRSVKYSVEQVIPRVKDGGMFVKFAIDGGTQEVAETMMTKINEYLRSRSLTWLEMFRGRRRAFLVQGEMFNEDIRTLTPSHRLRVEFWGPDLSIERLYDVYRKYGRITDIVLPSPASKELPRTAFIQFSKMKASTSARNCTFNMRIGDTIVKTGYEKLIKTRFIMNWLTSHPRVTLPAAAALLVTLLFAIFDPIRIFFIESKVRQRFDLASYLPRSIVRRLGLGEIKWVRESDTLNKIFGAPEGEQAEKEAARQFEGFELDDFNGGDALLPKLKMKLYEKPDTFMVIVGPSGSGKSELAFLATEDAPYRMIIDCEEIMTRANKDNELLTHLAQQVGYFPVFPFMVLLTDLLDRAVAATTGTKAGISSTTENQLKMILDCAAVALSRIVSEHRTEEQHHGSSSSSHHGPHDDRARMYPRYPVVVLDNFLKDKPGKDFSYIYNMLAEWGAWLVENQIAHVLVVGGTGQRGGGEVGVRRVLGKALPTKTFEVITLSDMNEWMTRRYVSIQLEQDDTPNMDAIVANVGGRVKDIELLVQKVKSGMTVPDAIEDLVTKSIIEIHKHGFGEDLDDKNNISWTPAQLWYIIKQFGSSTQISYDAVRFAPVFKGDEGPIRAMERAELITLAFHNGRPVSIRPNKPLYLTAIRRMISDERFTASMDSLLLKTLLEAETAKLLKTEEEVYKIRKAYSASRDREPAEMLRRMEFLLSQLSDSQNKIETFTAQMKETSKRVNS
ncbi:mitochondrial escape protein 2 [Sorochytrium milnesiophthora]